jgi:hypothetical protein
VVTLDQIFERVLLPRRLPGADASAQPGSTPSSSIATGASVIFAASGKLAVDLGLSSDPIYIYRLLSKVPEMDVLPAQGSEQYGASGFTPMASNPSNRTGNPCAGVEMLSVLGDPPLPCPSSSLPDCATR